MRRVRSAGPPGPPPSRLGKLFLSLAGLPDSVFVRLRTAARCDLDRRVSRASGDRGTAGVRHCGRQLVRVGNLSRRVRVCL